MSLSLAYWILVLVWIAFGIGGAYRTGTVWVSWSGTLLEVILFVMLGWRVFGPPIHG